MVPQTVLVGHNTGKPGWLLLHTEAWPWGEMTSHSSHHCLPQMLLLPCGSRKTDFSRQFSQWSSEIQCTTQCEQHHAATTPKNDCFTWRCCLAVLCLCVKQKFWPFWLPCTARSGVLSLHRQEWSSNAWQRHQQLQCVQYFSATFPIFHCKWP